MLASTLLPFDPCPHTPAPTDASHKHLRAAAAAAAGSYRGAAPGSYRAAVASVPPPTEQYTSGTDSDKLDGKQPDKQQQHQHQQLQFHHGKGAGVGGDETAAGGTYGSEADAGTYDKQQAGGVHAKAHSHPKAVPGKDGRDGTDGKNGQVCVCMYVCAYLLVLWVLQSLG